MKHLVTPDWFNQFNPPQGDESLLLLGSRMFIDLEVISIITRR